MVYFNVITALVWLVASASLAIGWWLDMPFNAGEKITLAYSVLFVLVRLTKEAMDSIESAIIRRHRHLDRRPQI